MLIPIVVGAAVAIAILAFVVWRRAHPTTPAVGRDARSDVNIFNLRVGDIVEHVGTSYLVESRIDLELGGFRWHEVLLVVDGDAANDRWLCVEEDDRLEVRLHERVAPSDIAASADEKTITFQGKTFRLEESGRATARRTKRSGETETLQVDFRDYDGPDGEQLSIERWGTEREIHHGRPIRPTSLMLLPGDGRGLLT